MGGALEARNAATYNGNFAAKLVLDVTLFDGVRRLLLDNGEELLDTHDDDGPGVSSVRKFVVDYRPNNRCLGVWLAVRGKTRRAVEFLSLLVPQKLSF